MKELQTVTLLALLSHLALFNMVTWSCRTAPHCRRDEWMIYFFVVTDVWMLTTTLPPLVTGKKAVGHQSYFASMITVSMNLSRIPVIWKNTKKRSPQALCYYLIDMKGVCFQISCLCQIFNATFPFDIFLWTQIKLMILGSGTVFLFFKCGEFKFQLSKVKWKGGQLLTLECLKLKYGI